MLCNFWVLNIQVRFAQVFLFAAAVTLKILIRGSWNFAVLKNDKFVDELWKY